MNVLILAFIGFSFIPNGYGRIENPYFIDEYGAMVIPRNDNPYFVGIPIDSEEIVAAVEQTQRELYALDERFGDRVTDARHLVLQIQVFSIPGYQLDDAKIAFQAAVIRFTQNYSNGTNGFNVEFRGLTSFNEETLITKPVMSQAWVFTVLQDYFNEAFKAKRITRLSMFTVSPHIKLAQLTDNDRDLEGLWDRLTNPLMPFGTQRLKRVNLYRITNGPDGVPFEAVDSAFL